MTADDQSGTAPEPARDATHAAEDPGFDWRCPGSDCAGNGCGRCTAAQGDDRGDEA